MLNKNMARRIEFRASTAAAAAGPDPWGVDYGACRRIDTYEKLNRIGEGTYGTVFRARDKRTGEIVALKQVLLHNEKQDGFPLTSLREMTLLRRVRHENCIRLREVAAGRDKTSVFLVMDYCEHDLSTLLEDLPRRLSASQVKCVMSQLLSAVAHLHSQWIVHRDLKLSNVLVDRNGRVVLADFGLARSYGHPCKPLTPGVYTLWYRAPELLLGAATYTEAVDMWALGCIMAELLGGRPVVAGDSEIGQLHAIFALLGAPTEQIWPGVERLPQFAAVPEAARAVDVNSLERRLPSLGPAGLDLLLRLFTYCPEQRISAQEALEHAFFKEEPLPCRARDLPSMPSRHTRKATAGRAAAGASAAAAALGARGGTSIFEQRHVKKGRWN